MAAKIKVESGLQLLARLTNNLDFTKFYPKLFENGVKRSDVIEIHSENNNCKTLLITDMVCEVLIPVSLGGNEASVLIFNTDGNLSVDVLFTTLEHKLKSWSCKGNNFNLDNNEIHNTMIQMLNNLFIIETYDAEQLYITIENLENILMEHPKISFIVFDTLTAYYWSEQQFKLMKMDVYLRNILRIVKNVITGRNTTIIYTRPQYFSSKIEGLNNHSAEIFNYIDYRINISRSNLDNGSISYDVTMKTLNTYVEKKFFITNGNLTWI